MTRGVVSLARRRAAQRHAERAWTCACGRTVHGNGGRSSHQRACLVYLSEMLAFHERTMEEGGAACERHVTEAQRLRALVAAQEARRARRR